MRTSTALRRQGRQSNNGSLFKGRLPILHLLFVLAIVYTLSSFVLFEELDTKDNSQKTFSVQTLFWRVKSIHRKVAHTVRRDLVKGVFLNKRLDAACSPDFGCILPRPTLFRSIALEKHEVPFAPGELPVFETHVDVPVIETPKERPKEEKADQASRKGGVERERRDRSETARLKLTPADPANEKKRAEPPYRLSKRVQGEMHDKDRIEKLLNTTVDIVMNQINLEMQGAISCGGKPVMEFRDVEAVLAAHPQLSQVIPEQDEIGSAKLGKCAVVGNSGSLLHSGHGKEIDAHDAVIRFNGAPTKNYEADVGSKTTVRIQNVDNLGFHEHDDKYLIFTARNKRDLQKFVNHRKRYRKRKQYAFNMEFWCHVWDWVSHRKLKPSSGLAGIILALRTCEHPINLYGFSHNDTNFHYFNHLPTKVTNRDVYNYHPLLEEAEIYEELELESLAHKVVP